MEESISTLRCILNSDQTAKLLIMMEKYRPADFSIFNIWNIKKLNKEQIKLQTQNLESIQEKKEQNICQKDFEEVHQER